MINNTEPLHEMVARGQIRVHEAALFRTAPAPLPAGFDFGKVEGMLLGAAVGDSVGAPTEGKTAEDRLRKYGEVRDYIPYRRSDNRAVGAPTDDTQLTFWTLKQLIRDDGLIPDNLAGQFCQHHIAGIGNTVKMFLSNYKDKHLPWYASGIDSLGNGALMRISPVVVPYLRRPHQSMYADAALDAMLTHNSFGNVAACVAFADILWSLLAMTKAPEADWWLDAYCSVARDLEGDAKYSRPSDSHYRGPLWAYTQEKVADALRRKLSTSEACRGWGSRANLFETVPSVIYILARYGHDPEEAIVRAANDTKDNDTVASIVGAAVGALHGVSGIPRRWIETLSGRTRSSDEGEVFRLILLAKTQFWSRGA